jgi:hypothetical protein
MKTTILILALAAASPAVRASTITGLCNTGMNTPCTLSDPSSPNGLSDLNFKTPVGTYAATFYTAGYFADVPSALLPTGADWISTWVNGANDESTGLYTYTEMLTASDNSSATITGSWATDNCGMIVAGAGETINSGGTIGGGITSSTCTSSSGNFVTPTPFSIAVSGSTSYALEFEVYNSSFSPTGLLVTDLQQSSVAEPSSALLALTGFALLSVGIRLRWEGNRTRP